MNNYIGHPSQIYGVEEHCLVGGRGNGMRLLQVYNGKGLEFTISLDRCADISRMHYKGVNMGFFAPCGYVAPAYYDDRECGFLKSFTAGFFTTCGLRAVGVSCEDNGEHVPMHGTISNTPAESFSYSEKDGSLIITAVMRDASLFAEHLLLKRRYTVSTVQNTIAIHDEIENIGTRTSPIMVLYHFNMGHPLLSENSEIIIPADDVKPRNPRAAEGTDRRLQMEHPQVGFEEQCYYYHLKSVADLAHVGIYNADINAGLTMSVNTSTLDCFTQWKMMGKYEYVLGLEPGNCNPDGRKALRENGTLKFLEPGATYKTENTLNFFDSYENFARQF